MDITGTNDLSPGLLRQRRNLILSSMGLIFLWYAEADLHAIHLLGLQATFGRPDAVVRILVVVTVYFVYRYFLYLNQDPAPGLHAEYYRRLNIYAEQKIRRLRDEKYPEGKGLHLEERLGVGKQGPFRWSILVPSKRDDMGGFEVERMDVGMLQVWPQALKAAVSACIARSYFTDYTLPIFLAVFSVGVGIYKLML